MMKRSMKCRARFRVAGVALLLCAALGCSDGREAAVPVSDVLGRGEPEFVSTEGEPAGFALSTLPTSGVVIAGKRGAVCYSHKGDEEWRFVVPAGDEIVASPAIAPDSSVFVLTRLSLIAISARGDVLWSIPVEAAELPAVVALGDGSVVVTSGSDALVSFDGTGRRQWRFELPDGDTIAALPKASNNSQVFVQGAARLYVIDPSGVPLWDRPM
jgi:hypothetical protein